MEIDGRLRRLRNNSTANAVANAIKDGAGICIPSFPINAATMLGFLKDLGEPLADYARLIPGEISVAPDLNVVKLRKGPPGKVRTHHRSGELVPHTARSWAKQRPRYFAMLMVEPGWRDGPTHSNGESLYVPWRLALDRMRRESALKFGAAFEILMDTPVFFEADKVREAVNAGPVGYQLPDSRDELDVGFRIKQDLPAVLRRCANANLLADAVEWLQTTARAAAMELPTVLECGDLVVLDNNRWAHGRCAFEITRNHFLNPSLLILQFSR